LLLKSEKSNHPHSVQPLKNVRQVLSAEADFKWPVSWKRRNKRKKTVKRVEFLMELPKTSKDAE